MRIEKNYVITSESTCGTFAYDMQTIYKEQGYKFLYRRCKKYDWMGRLVEAWNEPVKHFLVDENREEDLLRYGYYNQSVKQF